MIMSKTACRNLVFILGDQLSPHIASLRLCDPCQDIVLMTEVMDETAQAAFIKHGPPHFGDYQDASLWESRFSIITRMSNDCKGRAYDVKLCTDISRL